MDTGKAQATGRGLTKVPLSRPDVGGPEGRLLRRPPVHRATAMKSDCSAGPARRHLLEAGG